MGDRSQSAIRRRWATASVARVGWCSIGSSYSAEILASAGFDAVTIDLQHGMFGFESALAMLQSIHGHDVDAWVRVPGLDPAEITHALDAGATGIICPMIEDAKQAAALVSACRYPPLGRRSFGPSRNLLTVGAEYVVRANEEILVWAMLETPSGIANVEAICAVPGLDGVYIGPSDLAMAMGLPVGAAPPLADLEDVISTVLGCAGRHGIRAGIFCSTPAIAAEMSRRRFDVVTCGNDVASLRAGIATFLDAVDGIGPADGEGHHTTPTGGVLP